MRERLIETRANQPRAADLVREDPFAVGFLEGIELKRQIVVVRRDAGIADGQPLAATFARSAGGSSDATILSNLIVRVAFRESGSCRNADSAVVSIQPLANHRY